MGHNKTKNAGLWGHGVLILVKVSLQLGNPENLAGIDEVR
jgi:hypothetical protein